MNRVEWQAEVKKQLKLQNKSLKDIAETLGWTYGYTRQVVSYKRGVMNAVREISDLLGIEPYEVEWED